MNLWRMEPKSDILLFDQQHGYIRKGDFIAIALIVESYRRQFARDYKMLIDWHHDGIKMWHWFEDYKAPDDFPDLSWDWHLITGDTWMFADRCHMQYGIVPKLSNVPPQGDHVAIIPIFDAIYNCDRNWRLDLTARLIAMVKEAGEVPVVVGTTKTLAALRTVSPNATYIVDDLRRAGDAVLSAKLVIGGDTGLTHLAAVNASRAPVISLQGYGATARARNNFNTWAKHLQNAFYSYAQASENRCYAPKRAPNKPGVDMLMTVTRELTPAQWKEIEQWLQFNISA